MARGCSDCQALYISALSGVLNSSVTRAAGLANVVDAAPPGTHDARSRGRRPGGSLGRDAWQRAVRTVALHMVNHRQIRAVCRGWPDNQCGAWKSNPAYQRLNTDHVALGSLPAGYAPGIRPGAPADCGSASAALHSRPGWEMKCAMLSQPCTTQWDELRVAVARPDTSHSPGKRATSRCALPLTHRSTRQ